ncbi:HDOD domain-containing protein [Piscinibacter sp.]|jgi:HD-like signal output (HDOD) protein|uniref:HDOD domain-containing protein n=1 Tax=Piscinibacter sp. TaxID=1903157 RepID=UPI002F3E50F3
MPAVELPLTDPLRTLPAWTECLLAAEIPVMAATAEALEALRTNEDDVDANLLGEMIASDPLMTLKVLIHAGGQRSRRRVTDTETVTAALVMMGISPFFTAFAAQPTIEQALQDSPEALAGLNEVLRRAHRAANFALGFAVRRMDHDAAVIHQAALLHDFAEMLLWCHAPALALRIHQAQRTDPTLRSSTIQLEVLNIELRDLQQSLMQAWRLPELLVRITDDRHAQHPSAKSVVLAIQLARHTAKGWDNAAIPDDVHDIAQLLNLSDGATLQLLNELDT